MLHPVPALATPSQAGVNLALASRAFSRISRLVEKRSALKGAAVEDYRPPSSDKAAARLADRLRRCPAVAFASAVKSSRHGRFVFWAESFFTEAAIQEMDGAKYQDRMITYIIAGAAWSGRKCRFMQGHVTFSEHAVRRWAERAERLDLRVDDKSLLKALDAEAQAICHIRTFRSELPPYAVYTSPAGGKWAARETGVTSDGQFLHGAGIKTFLKSDWRAPERFLSDEEAELAAGMFTDSEALQFVPPVRAATTLSNGGK